MIPYSLNVAALIAACWVFYKVLLQKETYYRLNRQLLMGCIALAFVLPLIPVPQKFSLRESAPVQTTVVNEVSPTPTAGTNSIVSKPVAQSGQNAAAKTERNPLNRYDVIKWLAWIYWGGVAIFGANFLLQIAVLIYQAYRKPVIRDGKYRIVELDDDKAPCSFGNNIFINPTKYDWETYEQILQHEKVHIQQGHSFDLIVAELMLVMQWFNPFAWLYRREVESNLEFLTDDAMIRSHKVDAEVYQLSLLKVSVPNLSMRVTTNYNQSLLKTRIIMMNTKRSNIHSGWKYFTLIPLLSLLVCGLNEPTATGSPLPMHAAIKVPITVADSIVNPELERLGTEMNLHMPYYLRYAKADADHSTAALQKLNNELAQANIAYSPAIEKEFATTHNKLDRYPFLKKEMLAVKQVRKDMTLYSISIEQAEKRAKMSPDKRTKYDAYAKFLNGRFDKKAEMQAANASAGHDTVFAATAFTELSDLELELLHAQVKKHYIYVRKIYRSPKIGTNALNVDLKAVEDFLAKQKLSYTPAMEKHIDSVHTEFENYPLFKKEYVLWSDALKRTAAYMASPKFVQNYNNMSPEKRKKYDAYVQSLENNLEK